MLVSPAVVTNGTHRHPQQDRLNMMVEDTNKVDCNNIIRDTEGGMKDWLEKGNIFIEIVVGRGGGRVLIMNFDKLFQDHSGRND